MKKIILVAVVIWIIVDWGQSPSSSQNQKADEAERRGRTCSLILGGLQYRIIPNSISVKSGENINVQISVQNMTKELISFRADSFVNLYDVVVTGPDGKKLLSSMEILEKKQVDGTITPEELGSLLPINSAPRKTSLAPHQEITIEYNLNLFYNFQNKGKYCGEIGKKGEFSSFGKFEVEVK